MIAISEIPYDYIVVIMNQDEPIGDRTMSTEAFSVRTDKKTVKQLDRLAKQLDRSRNYIVNQAIEQLLELHSWQDDQVKQGIRAADAGEFASDDEIDRIFGKHRDAG